MKMEEDRKAPKWNPIWRRADVSTWAKKGRNRGEERKREGEREREKGEAKERGKRRIGESEVEGRFESVTSMTSACISVYTVVRGSQCSVVSTVARAIGRDEAIRSREESGESQGWKARQKRRWRGPGGGTSLLCDWRGRYY